MASPTIDNTVAPVAGLSATSGAGTDIGDLVIVVTWERAGAGVPTHTIESGYTEIRSHSHDDGSTDGRLSVAYKVATEAGAVAYTAYTSSVGTETWTGLYILNSGTYSRGILANSATITGTGVPNPPAVINLDFTKDYLAIAIGAWHLSTGATVTPTHSVYGDLVHVDGSATAELAICSLAVAAGVVSIDPGAYGDDVTPNGSASMTLAVPMAPATATDGAWTRKENIQGFRTAPAATSVLALDQVEVDDLIIVATGNSSQDVTGVTDSLSNTYTEYVVPTTFGSNNIVALYYTVSTAAGSRVLVTTTMAGAPDVNDNVAIGRYGGVDTVSPTRDFAVTAGTTTTWNSGDATAVSGDMLFGYCANLNGTVTPTGSGTWVELGPAATSDLMSYGEQLDVATGDHSFNGTGFDSAWGAIVAIFRAGSAGAFEVVASAGAYTLTGTAASLQATQIFDAEAGSYALTGTAANLEHGLIITADAGAYSLTGTAAALQATRIFNADSGSYALTGTAAGLQATRIFSADAGSYALTGSDAELEHVAVVGGSSYHYNRKRRR